jgi:hypothetical protein
MDFTVFCPHQLVSWTMNSLSAAVFTWLSVLNLQSSRCFFVCPALRQHLGAKTHDDGWKKTDYWLKRSGDGITCFTVWHIFVPTVRTEQKRIKSCNKMLRRNNLVIIENRLRNGQAGFRISVSTRDFSLLQKNRPAPRSKKPLIQYISGAFLLEVKMPVCVRLTTHPVCRAKVKNEWSSKSLPPSHPVYLQGVYTEYFNLHNDISFMGYIC